MTGAGSFARSSDRPTWNDLLRALSLSTETAKQAFVLGIVCLASTLCFLLFGLLPTTVLAGVGGAVAVLLAVLNPRLATTVMVFSFFFGQGETSVTIVQVIGALALAAGMLGALARKQWLHLGNLGVWLALWGAWVSCSFFYSHSVPAVWAELREFAVNVAIFALVVHYFPTLPLLRRLISVIFLAIVVNACVSIAQWLSEGGAPGFRATGVKLDPNYLGCLCVACTGFAIVRCWSEGGWTSKILWSIGGAMCFFAMLLTASRTAHVCTLLLGLFLFVEFPKRRLLVVAIVAALVALYPYAPKTYRERVQGIVGEISRSVPVSERHDLTIRGYLFEAGMRIWRDHPILGAGVGSFRKLLLTVGYNPGVKWGKGFVPHNAYIGLLAESGIVGLLIYGGLLLIGGINFVVGLQESLRNCPAERWIVLCASLFMVIHLVMTLSVLMLSAHSLFVCLAMGSVARTARQS